MQVITAAIQQIHIQQEMDNVMGDTIVRLDQQVLHKVHVETVIIALQEQQRLLHVQAIPEQPILRLVLQ